MTIVYERRGTGTPLVLLHGIGHRWQAWEPVLDRLAEVHDVVALDLPGFGGSDRLAHSDMPSVLRSLTGFFAELGLDRPHVAGNSLGGALALELAAGDHVASATALAPAGFWKFRHRAYALGVLSSLRGLGYFPGAMVRPFLSTPARRRLTCSLLYGRPGLLPPEVPFEDLLGLRQGKAFLAVAWAGRNYVYSGQPTGDVTIAWGTKDRILRPGQAERAKVALPGARHVSLPGCGHLPMHDDPELVSRVILETTQGR